LYATEYFERPNGKQPAKEWLDRLPVKHQGPVYDVIGRLEDHGLDLLGTNMLRRIEGSGPNFYELRRGQCRVTVYHDITRNAFVLLHGFLKKRRRERLEIDKARALLREYLGSQGGKADG